MDAVGFYQRTVDDLVVRPYWAVRMWAAHHPRTAYAVGFVLLVCVLVGHPVAAHAATVQNPLIPTGLKDQDGVDLGNYVVLPIDTGGITDMIKGMVSGLTGLLWAIYLALVSWMIWLVDWLLRFEWLDLLITPFATIADVLQQFLLAVGWLPLAMTAAGAVGGTFILFGKWGKGAQELLMSAICVVLATGMLANPVASLRGAEGGFETAKTWGGELSALVVSENFEEGTQVEDPAEKVSSVITGQLVNLFIRQTAQTIAFGSPLEGDCDELFTEKMIDEPPATHENTVKDEIRDCDDDAKAFSESLNWSAPISLILMVVGALVLFSLPIALAVLLMTSVLGTLLSACKSMFFVYVSVFPVSRFPLWRSVMDMLTGLVGIVVVTVLLAGSLRVVADTVVGLNDIGVNLVMTSVLSAGLIVVIITFLVKAKDNTTKMGAAFARMLSKFGATSGSSGPVRSMGGALAVGAAAYGVKKFAPVAGRAALGAVRGVGMFAHRGHQFANATRARGLENVATANRYKHPGGPSTPPQGPSDPNNGTGPSTPPTMPPSSPTPSPSRPTSPEPAAATAPVSGPAERRPHVAGAPEHELAPPRPHEVEVRAVDIDHTAPVKPRIQRRRIMTDREGRAHVTRPTREVIYDYSQFNQNRRRRSVRTQEMRQRLADLQR